MRVRFGYVAMSTVLKDCSPSRTVTAANLVKIQEEEARTRKLARLARENLRNTQRLLHHNHAHDIEVFRITSKLIPLATHPLISRWDWHLELKDELEALGNTAKEYGMRISAHPDHFSVLNSPRTDVNEKSLEDLQYHHDIFEGMGFDDKAKLVLHLGGTYGDKDSSMNRFQQNFKAVPDYLKRRIILENDDKAYTADDVYQVCCSLNIPMVLDVHHHWCNKGSSELKDMLEGIFSTWNGEDFPPKVHISSPRDQRSIRSHADNVEVEFFLWFLEIAKRLEKDFDVMIEAKNKDRALFKLMDDLGDVSWVKILDQASIEC